MLDGEKNIIKRAIRGESSAFGSLYDGYQPAIYRFIYLKVNHREEAEDLTHQVFLKAWQNIGDFRQMNFPFSSWLYRIARNTVIDHYRTRKQNFDIELVSETELGTTDDSQEEEMDFEINIGVVRTAIAKLNPIEQDVIIMRFVEDLSPKEIASTIDKTPEAVRLIQHRAIKNIRKIMADNDK